MDVGCYCLSGTRFVAGAEPERVSAEQVLGGEGSTSPSPPRCASRMTCSAQFDCGLSIGHRHEPRGDRRGRLAVPRRPWHGRTPGIVLTRDGEAERIEVAPANPYTHELENFARAARGEAPPLLGAADALGQARAIEALYAAAESGRSVALEASVA